MGNIVDRLAGASSSLAFKAPCRLATTAAITLSGYQTIDGVLPTSTEHVDLRRILVRHQTDASANGIYIMDTGTWVRTKDFDGTNDFRQGTRVFVWGGSTQSGGYVVTSSMVPDTFEFDDDDIDFTAQAAVDITNWEFADGTGLYDDSGNEQLILQKSSTVAANFLEVTNSTAGSAPQLSAAGDDAAIDLKFTAKSTGAITSTSVARFDGAITSTAITANGTITASSNLNVTGPIRGSTNVGAGTTAPSHRLAAVGSAGAFAGARANGIFSVSDGTGADGDTFLQVGTVSDSYVWLQAQDPGVAQRPIVLNPGPGSGIPGASVVIGYSSAALSSAATDGLLYIPTSTSASTAAPIGTPTAHNATVPLLYNTSQNRLWIYNGAWRSVALAT